MASDEEIASANAASYGTSSNAHVSIVAVALLVIFSLIVNAVIELLGIIAIAWLVVMGIVTAVTYRSINKPSYSVSGFVYLFIFAFISSVGVLIGTVSAFFGISGLVGLVVSLFLLYMILNGKDLI